MRNATNDQTGSVPFFFFHGEWYITLHKWIEEIKDLFFVYWVFGIPKILEQRISKKFFYFNRKKLKGLAWVKKIQKNSIFSLLLE